METVFFLILHRHHFPNTALTHNIKMWVIVTYLHKTTFRHKFVGKNVQVNMINQPAVAIYYIIPCWWWHIVSPKCLRHLVWIQMANYPWRFHAITISKVYKKQINLLIPLNVLYTNIHWGTQSAFKHTVDYTVQTTHNNNFTTRPGSYL
jgi:hypothetical protein